MPKKYDLIVIGGGPAGYAAAIRAGQLKKRVLCVEKENLGGTCLNWGCIPTKALLDAGALVRKMQTEAAEFGVSFDNFKIDFAKPIERSRKIAGKLNKGIAHLFSKYRVDHVMATAKVAAKNKVEWTDGDGKTDSAECDKILVATGAKPRSLPGMEIDRTKIISSREAMSLTTQPKKLAVIGAGAIGCEFADFYSSMGTDVTIVEFLPHLLPNEDEDCSIALERAFKKRGINMMLGSKTTKIMTSAEGVVLTVEPAKGGDEKHVEADLVLMAVGVTGNIDDLFADSLKVETDKGHVKVNTSYETNVPGVWAVGDVIGPPWLAHVAHHEAVYCVERMFGFGDHHVDYDSIPGCTYTHPQVASMGLTEKKGPGDGPEAEDRQVPLQRQRPGDGRGRDGRLREADLRRRDRRTHGRPHGRRERDGAVGGDGGRQEAGGDGGGDHRGDAPAPDALGGDHGGGGRGGRAGDSPLATLPPSASGGLATGEINVFRKH